MWFGCIEGVQPFKRVLQPTDTPEERFRKKLVLVMNMAASFIFSVSVANNAQYENIARVMSVPALVVSILSLTQIIYERKTRDACIEASLYGYALTSILIDLRFATVGAFLMWSGFIVYIDVCLVCKLRTQVSRNLIVVLLLWLLLNTIETITRMGLYDLPGLPSQGERKAAVDCESLPCKTEVVFSMLIFMAQVTTFLLDYYFTRGFAHALHEEHDKMKAVVTAAEEIADSLSRFDLEEAEAHITSSHLPPPLHAAFSDIMGNLRLYRPYLPQSCLHGEDTLTACSDDDDDEPTCATRMSTFEEDKPSQRISIKEVIVTERRKVSYAVANMLGSHAQIAADVTQYGRAFSAAVSVLAGSLAKHHGVMGVVLGDHLHASFNSTKRCPSHARHAVEAAILTRVELEDIGVEMNMGLTMGQVYCGSFGSAEMQSFGMIGPVVLHASLLERLGRGRERPLLCSGSVHSEVSYAFTTRMLLLQVRLPGRGEAELVYELVCTREAKEGRSRSVGGGEEWMYCLRENAWELYNDAGQRFLAGDKKGALRCLDLDKGHASSADDVELLRELVEKGAVLEEVMLAPFTLP